MQKRTLTIVFERAVYAGIPATVEITVIPLAVPTNPVSNTVLVGGPQTQVVLLANTTTTVTVSLVPSGHPDLDETLPYRIAWRERYTGHQYSADFVMPDADTYFGDLAFLGCILSTNGVTADVSPIAAQRALRTILNVTTPTTLPSSGSDYVVFLSGSGAVTLPSAVNATSKYSIKNNKTTASIVTTTLGQTIDGQSGLSLDPGEAVEIIANGANWTIF